MKNFTYFLLVGLLMLATAGADFAQDKTALAKSFKSETKENTKTEVETDSDEEKADAKSAPTTSADATCESCRWFEPTVASVSFRYRTISDYFGTRIFNQGQQRVLLGAKFKFDKQGKYTINAQASSGYYFNWAYADVVGGGMKKAARKATTALGLPPFLVDQISNNAANSTGWNLFVRQLYFSAKPVKGLEFQYGSLPILRGQNSETTSFDDDGYVAGGRVSVKRPDKFFFDEISATYAYLGKTDRIKANGERELIDDVYTPNLFRRWQHLGNSNYHQFLVQKKIGKRAVVSADYTFHERTDFLRGAAKINIPESKILDFIRVEAYQRIGDNEISYADDISHQLVRQTIKGAFGFSIHGEKTLAKKVTIGGGYNDIDYDYSINQGFYNVYSFALNGDRMGVGKRLYLTANYKINDEFSISSYMSNTYDIPAGRILFNKSHINFALNYDLLKGVKKHFGWFR